MNLEINPLHRSQKRSQETGKRPKYFSGSKRRTTFKYTHNQLATITEIDPKATLAGQLQPWQDAISNPSKIQIMTLGSVPGINTHHKAALTALYGPAAIREIYSATEGMFG